MTTAIATWSAQTLPHPFLDREIVVVADAHVDPEFGTGAVKVTPAHDPNDFEIGVRHKPADAVDAGHQGPDRRHRNRNSTEWTGSTRGSRCAKRWPREGRIVAEKRPYLHSVGHSERSGEPIEPRLTLQWWVKVESLAKAAGDAVRNGDTVIHPASLEPRWFGWVDNMHDWCISRQLWWGHRIPIWHGPDGETGLRRTRRDAAGGLGAGPRRARHLVLARRCGRSPRWAGRTTPPSWRSSIRPACSSPATTSCSSGWRG